MLTLGELFKVKVIFGVGFHRLKYEPSLKSLNYMQNYSQLSEFDLLFDFDLDL